MSTGAGDNVDELREVTLRAALDGRCVVVTRPGDSGVALTDRLLQLGAAPLYIPVIAVESVADSDELDAAFDNLDSFAWITFTSVNAVSAVADRLRRATSFGAAKLPTIAAVGAATSAALEALGVTVDFVPAVNSGDAMGATLPIIANERVLLLRGESALPALADRLRQRHAQITEIVVYRTVPDVASTALFASLATKHVDAITFTSPSTVMHFMLGSALGGFNAIAEQRNGGLRIVCIGGTTAAAARQHGLNPDAIAREPSQEGLIDALASCFRAATPS